MDLSPHEADLLLGAWALGALDPDEAAAVDRAIADDPALALTAAELGRAARALAASVVTTPPGEVRASILDAARTGPPARPSPTDPVTLFANQVEALRRLLDELSPDDFRRPARPYDWSVHGLVAHLLVIERYAAGQLGLDPAHPDGSAAHLELGADTIDAELCSPPAHTAGEWYRAATRTIEAIAGGSGPALDARVEFHRWPLSTGSLLIARAFEVWTHTDDIRRATGRPLSTPDAGDLRAMSQFSVTSLPLVLPLVAPAASLGGARVVLTGVGGGTIDLGDPARRDVLIATDVVDYCRLAARRIEIDELEATVEGDRELAGNLLAAARVFAV